MIGYARVSTVDQSLDLQRDALLAAGCERIFVETASGAASDRPVLAAMHDFLRPGDVLCVWRLDRLGRSLKHLVEILEDLRVRKVAFRSLTEAIDTSTPTGTLMTHLIAAFAQFERDLIRERTIAGLTAARARGRVGGRKRIMTEKKIALAQQMYDGGNDTAQTIADTLGVSRATLYRHLVRKDSTLEVGK